MLRYCKIVLILAVAFLGLQGVLNLVAWETGYALVEATTSMADVPGDKPPWASGHPLLVSSGLLFIIAGKLLGGSLCLLGSVRMWQARSASAESFQAAKYWAQVGGGVLLVLLFGGFLFLAGQFYMGWQTELGQGASSGAFQLGGAVALILLFVNQRDT